MPYKDELRKRLVGAAGRRSRQRRRLRRAAGATVAILMLSTVAIVSTQLDTAPSSAGVLQIRQDGPELVVTVADLTATPEKVQKELESAGLTASVEGVPMPPAAVGHFVFVTIGDAFRPEDPVDGVFRSFVVTEKDRAIELQVGRPSVPGERFAKSMNALDAGGPLHCSGVDRLPVPEAAREIERRGFESSWQRYTPNGFVTSTPEDSSQLSISQVLHSAPNELVIYTAPHGVQPLVGSMRSNDCSEQSFSSQH